MLAFAGVKLCTSCQRTKPLEKFYTAGRHKGGSVRFHSHCKSCKLENEASQRMHPRKGVQEAEMSGLPPHLHPEQSGGQQNTLLQAPRLPQPPMGPIPGLLNHQQLQALMVFRQNPALFSNPVLQSQLAMLMWSQMQHQQVPMWPMHQPPPMLQPVTGQQPSSAAAQSASTHQPSCQGPVIPAAAAGRLSEECNSSGGSNDSGCIQTVSGNSPKADQSPPGGGHFGGHRFADDSDSAVTWADRAGRGADQTACTQSRSPGQPDASGTQFCLHNSGQTSGRDVTSSSHLPEQARWPPAAAPPPALTPFATARPRHSTPRASGQSTADAIQLARAASNAAQQSLAATAAITDQPLARRGSSSLFDHLRQADRHWMQVTQAPPAAQPAKAMELKRSSRQAARALDQSQRATDAEEAIPSLGPQQVEADGSLGDSLQPLRWGRRVRNNRVRGQRQAAKAADRFPGWTVSGGVLKPVASRHAPASARAAARAPAAQGRAFRLELGLFKAARAPEDPKAAAVEPLLLAAAAAKAPEEIAAAFIPRHSRKKGKVQRSAFE
ncbi:hypothetical protein ABBQ32_010549 [Trebouxia sp. C0010 RCD-2024]